MDQSRWTVETSGFKQITRKMKEIGATLPSTEEKIWRAQEKKSTDQNRQEIIYAVSWDEVDEELLAPIIKKGSNEIQTDENNPATNLPTTVEEEGYQQPHIELVSNIQYTKEGIRQPKHEK